MKNTIAGLFIFVAGVASGVAFVVSCGNAPRDDDDGNGARYIGPPRAIAQLNCSQFQTTIIETSDTYLTPTTLPAGWVPFGISTANNVVAARCAP